MEPLPCRREGVRLLPWWLCWDERANQVKLGWEVLDRYGGMQSVERKVVGLPLPYGVSVAI